MGDSTKRILDLLAALQDGDGVSGAELASRLGVSTKTVQRDIERLRSYGYAVDASHGRRAKYRLGAGTAIPPLVLDDEEVAAVLAGLALRAAVADATGTTEEAIGAEGDPAGAEGDTECADRVMRTLDRLVPQPVRERSAAATARMLPTEDRATARPGLDRVDRLHAVEPTGTHFEPRPLPGDAGDLWLDLLVWYDRGRTRPAEPGAIRCEDAR